MVSQWVEIPSIWVFLTEEEVAITFEHVTDVPIKKTCFAALFVPALRSAVNNIKTQGDAVHMFIKLALLYSGDLARAAEPA